MIKGISLFFGPPHEGKNQSKQLRIDEEKIREIIKLTKKIGFNTLLFNGYLENEYFPYAKIAEEEKIDYWYHLPYHWAEKPKNEEEMWKDVKKIIENKHLKCLTVGCEIFGDREKIIKKNHDKIKSMSDMKTCYDHHMLEFNNPTKITDITGVNIYSPLQALQWWPETHAYFEENKIFGKTIYDASRHVLSPLKNSHALTNFFLKQFMKRTEKPIVITEFACRGEPKIIDQYYETFNKNGINDSFYYNITPYIYDIKGITDRGFSHVNTEKTIKYFSDLNA